MKTKAKKYIVTIAFVILLLGTLLPPVGLAAATSGTHTPVTDVTVSVSGATDNSMTSGAITVTAKGTAGFLFFPGTPKTTTITVTNNSDATATVSFDWTATNVNTLTIDGTTYTATSGSFSKTLEATAGANSFEIKIVTGANSTENKLVMKNFDLAVAATSSNITVSFDSALGSVTAGGSAITSGSVCEATLADGITLVATANSGTKFLGWVDTSSHTRLSPDSSYTLKHATDTTVKAAFASTGSKAWFIVDGVYWTDDLTTAVGLGSTIVLAEDGTLPAGNYTIPSGDTLLIPFDSANTLYKVKSGGAGANDAEYGNITGNKTIYRTLTLADGVHLVVAGELSLSAKHCSDQPDNGAPCGPCSRIDMKAGSTITINNQAALYAWGFITGSGEVTVKSGGTVYELFQIKDYRGGNATSDMNNNSEKVFPLSQYYVQNVEVPMTLEAGAMEYVHTSVEVSILGVKDITVPFIGTSSSMFTITSGSITKDYSETEDRLEITVNGKVSMVAFSMNIPTGLIGDVSFNTSNYVLPLNGNITVDVAAGSEIVINQDLALLPGAIINVDGGAIVTLGSGKSIILYDADNWGKYCGAGNATFVASNWSPTRTHTRNANDLVDAKVCINGTLDASAGAIYVTEGNANIYSNGFGVIKTTPGTATTTYQASYNATDKTTSYPPITIKPAILQNSAGYDPATQATAGAAAGTVYGYDGLKWYIPNATLNELTVEYRLDDYLWLNAYFTLNDIDVTQADVTNEVLTVNNGAELYVTGGKVYLVKKIPADQIPDDQTFIVTYDNGTAQVTAPFSANLTDLRAKDTTDEKTKTLIDKLLAYGDAAKLYFGNGKADSQLPLDLTTLPDREKAKDANKNYVDAENVGSGTDKLLSIKGMNVLFEERLSLMVAIQLKKDTTLYDITSLGSGNVAQIGLLVGEKDGGVLTVDNLGTYGKAYILYGNSNKIASDNVPVTEKDLPVYQAANKETTAWNSLVDDEGRTVIYLDLKSSEYTSSFELRPFVILNDGTVMYAAQYEYGLGAYIKSILSKENLVVPEGKDANAFRNLLVRTWEYALAADLCF